MLSRVCSSFLGLTGALRLVCSDVIKLSRAISHVVVSSRAFPICSGYLESGVLECHYILSRFLGLSQVSSCLVELSGLLAFSLAFSSLLELSRAPSSFMLFRRVFLVLIESGFLEFCRIAFSPFLSGFTLFVMFMVMCMAICICIFCFLCLSLVVLLFLFSGVVFGRSRVLSMLSSCAGPGGKAQRRRRASSRLSSRGLTRVCVVCFELCLFTNYVAMLVFVFVFLSVCF